MNVSSGVVYLFIFLFCFKRRSGCKIVGWFIIDFGLRFWSNDLLALGCKDRRHKSQEWKG